MASKTLLTLRQRLLKLLGESNTNNMFDTTILNAILNDTAEEFAKETLCLKGLSQQNITSGIADYIIPPTLSVGDERPFQIADRGMFIYSDASGTTKDPITLYDMTTLNNYEPNWKTLTSAKPKYALVTTEPLKERLGSAPLSETSKMTITLVPTPNYTSTDKKGVTVYYYRLPQAMSADGDFLDMPERYENAIIYGSLWKLFATANRKDLAEPYFNLYQREMDKATAEKYAGSGKARIFGLKYGIGAISPYARNQ